MLNVMAEMALFQFSALILKVFKKVYSNQIHAFPGFGILVTSRVLQ